MTISQIAEMRSRRDRAREVLAELTRIAEAEGRSLTGDEEQRRAAAEADVTRATRWISRAEVEEPVGLFSARAVDAGAAKRAFVDDLLARLDGRVAEGDWDVLWAAKQARQYVLELIDIETAETDPDRAQELADLQAIFARLSTYITDEMGEPSDADDAGMDPSMGYESDPARARERASALAQESTATLVPVDETFDVATLSEATFDLAKNELTVTFLQPGFNRSGARYYKPEAISEAVDNGTFKGLKMFMNHASPQELQQRPERSLTDWVSTMKETWVDPVTGSGKAKVKVVRGWFADFLKELQENDALDDVGLSIFAQGRAVNKRVEGRLTSVVEQFERAMSVDWVTEPGAGGRVEAIWESYQPIKQREEELNVLSTMKAEEVLAQLKTDRRDVLQLLESERESEEAQSEQLREAHDKASQLETELSQLREALGARESELTALRETALRATQADEVRRAVASAKLPITAGGRIERELARELYQTDAGELDADALTRAVTEAITAEREYADQLLKESGRSGGITGLGESNSGGGVETPSRASKIEETLAARFGHVAA